MSTPTPPAPDLEQVAEDAAATFVKLVVPVVGLALANHYQGQVVNISAVYQAIYAGAAAAVAVLIHGVPAALTVKQRAKAVKVEAEAEKAAADLQKLVAAVRAAEAADAAPKPPAV